MIAELAPKALLVFCSSLLRYLSPPVGQWGNCVGRSSNYRPETSIGAQTLAYPARTPGEKEDISINCVMRRLRVTGALLGLVKSASIHFTQFAV